MVDSCLKGHFTFLLKPAVPTGIKRRVLFFYPIILVVFVKHRGKGVKKERDDVMNAKHSESCLSQAILLKVGESH